MKTATREWTQSHGVDNRLSTFGVATEPCFIVRWCECRWSRNWREIWMSDWKFLHDASLGSVARADSHAIGARYANENLFHKPRRDFASAASRAIGTKINTVEKISIADLVVISWLAALATSPQLGKKLSIACLEPISWPSGTRNMC